MLQEILLAVIVVLLLVVLVPVGAALFQRLRTDRSRQPLPPAGRAPRRPPPPLTTPPPPLAEPAPPPAPAVASAPAPAPAPAPASRPEGESTPAGTEMVQWYGMLHVTSGVLEGKRFIIEEEGLYIGRDPALSTIVIPDTRISKRHVRIVPRDGKVWAVDQESTNGTYLASAPGQRITEVQLKRGDELILGEDAATILYQI
ncbi:MAG TPA: FHA domain-containing protein [Thermoanaerobaculia bacterium]|nr:FHA domain-containing protein [Thermoanaerobaculia bacterium]